MSRTILVAAILLVSITIAHAACGIDSIDLSGMKRSTDYTGQDTAQPTPYQYNMNVCAGSNLCQASICQKADKMYSLGTYDGATTWSYIDSANKAAGIKASMNNGDTCIISGIQQPRIVNIVFPCSSSDSSTFTVAENPTCTFTITLPTTKSCPGGSGTVTISVGISGGWVFIIILLVVIPIYIVVGCIYKTKKLGTSGKESCPNWDFWSSIPGLVKDGCRFVFSGCKKGSTYNQL